MPKITNHLWFDKEAKEAAEFYTNVFGGTIKSADVLEGTPSGSVDILTIDLQGSEFTLISAGPLFKFTPAISFLVACDSKEEVDKLWAELSQGGEALMPLQSYPFSEHYGWIKDRYGLSWQVMFMGDIPFTQKITPTIMFIGDHCGQAEEAMQFYASIFPNASVDEPMRYQEGQGPDKPGTIAHGQFTLDGQRFAAMDSAHDHAFSLNEAISFIVHCKDQAELDTYWEKLSAVPESEQCGWLKDKYGLSWQIVPMVMDEMMTKATPEQKKAVTQAFLKMKKFDIAELQRAFDAA